MQSLKNIFKYAVGTAAFALFFGCSPQETKEQSPHAYDLSDYNTENAWHVEKNVIAGNALGTSFMIKTGEDTLRISPQEIEDFFDGFNEELSTYWPHSLISQFNNEQMEIDLNATQYFKSCFEKSQRIYQQTHGAFDPTLFPLVNLWGFIQKSDRIPTQEEVDSTLAFVGFEEGKLYTYTDGVLKKNDARFELVFNAIAKGQSVDELAKILTKNGQESFYIEVGGELITKGMNDRNMKWVIGIDEPVETNTGIGEPAARSLENYIEISGKAMATSGNYRDFYEHEGVVYSHTISPISGKPVRREILSATVIADDVATADAYATAFMVMGVEESLALVDDNPDLELAIYLLYDDGEGNVKRAYNNEMLLYLMDR